MIVYILLVVCIALTLAILSLYMMLKDLDREVYDQFRLLGENILKTRESLQMHKRAIKALLKEKRDLQ